MGVTSKTYGLAGLRIGWIATQNQELLDELGAFKDYTSICNSAPSEFLATLALRNAEPIVERNLRIIRNNLERLDSFFALHEDWFEWYRPKAGPIAFPRLRRGEVGEFCRDLVERAGVLLLPGSLYTGGFSAFRIGFGRNEIAVALDRLDAYLHSFAS